MMTISIPEDFPMLRAAARKPERLDAAITSVVEGAAAGSIRNAVLNDAKFVISSAVNDAWKNQVSEPFFYAGKWESQPKDIQELNDGLSVYGLHDVIAASKKIGKSKATGSAIDAMKCFVAEVLPLALAVADLKTKVVKGRAPNPAPAKLVNPDKIVKTCPVCFRQIAVVGHVMAHHGYQRPGDGFQTPSCPGINFRPLEVSTEGLVWLISTLRNQHNVATSKYANRSELESLIVTKGRKDNKLITETITRESPDWNRQFSAYVNRLETELSQLDWQLGYLDEKLKNWKPEVTTYD